MLLVIEKGNVLFPRQAYHDAKAMLLRSIQKPAWRYGVSADRVQVVSGHLSKVSLDSFWAAILAAILARAKWAIRDAPDVQLLIPHKDEFALHARSDISYRSRCNR